MLTSPPALRNSAVRRLLAAQLPADFADWLDFVAIGSLLAFAWAVPPYVYAVLAAGMALPYLIVGPFAGAMVDRLPIRPVLVGSDLGRGITTALLFFAPNWQVLVALVALRSALDCFFTPAKQAALQSLTTDADRTSANGLSQAINEASKVLSPVIGGSLLAVISPGSLFLINALLSFAAAVLGLRLGPVPKPARNSSPGLFKEVAAGLVEAWSLPLLRTAIAMFAAGFFAMFLYDTYFAPLLSQMQLTQFHLGLALSAVGCGGLLGALLFGFAKTLHRPFRWVAVGFTLGGAAAILLGWFGMMVGPVALPALLAVFATLSFLRRNDVHSPEPDCAKHRAARPYRPHHQPERGACHLVNLDRPLPWRGPGVGWVIRHALHRRRVRHPAAGPDGIPEPKRRLNAQCHSCHRRALP